ncbi:hypothetical protein [Candidatus Magnetominusculus xianensis]|uniref:Magnetosome protein Mad25 n=1 Tax=Candidatus Magnetominusculus xianensis TaxID=1748249 RepID=A0ABR5SJM7_9BACT|nr:hypothetical protein [Candidatus Magnetominusculus xianensis]KWT94846.1 magnetosome protein Mad25 [Candidatus Magnetominusculus xianensis]MBF0404738.1 hypothetical protein [Nitrospirota bacterium]
MDNINEFGMHDMSLIPPDEEIAAAGAASFHVPEGASWALTSTLPEIRGVELLRDASGTVDVGKTIREMFLCIQNMERQLNDVLSINASLERDIKSSRELITNLRTEKQDLQRTIDTINREIPSKRELQAQVEHLIEERNSSQSSVRDMKNLSERARYEAQVYKGRIEELQEEKADLLRDINYLESKISAALKKINAYAKEINILKGERHIHREKISKLEKSYRDCVDERDSLISRTID